MPRTRNCHLHVYERLWIVSQNRRIGAGNQNRARFFRRLRRIIVLFRVAVRIVQGLITIAMHHVKERHDAHVVTVWLCVNPTVGICQIEVALADALHIVWGYELQMGKSVRLGVLTVGGTSGLIGNYLATAGRPNQEDLQMIDDLELTWHDDRVGDLDPAIAPSAPAPASPWQLPVLS